MSSFRLRVSNGSEDLYRMKHFRWSQCATSRAVLQNTLNADELLFVEVPQLETQTRDNVSQVQRSRFWRLQFLQSRHCFGQRLHRFAARTLNLQIKGDERVVQVVGRAASLTQLRGKRFSGPAVTL